jgi:general secretion pathway protein K
MKMTNAECRMQNAECGIHSLVDAYPYSSLYAELATEAPALRHSSFVIRHSSPSSQRGSALMLVIWAIVFMGVSVMGVVEYLNFSVRENGLAARDFRALHLAECGIALGLHPTLKPGDPALKQKIGSDSGFEVMISSEGERIPINYLTDTGYREATSNLFIQWGLSADEANIAVDSLADWMDPDNDPRAQGAESDYYKGQGFADFPRQQGFSSLGEMLLVRGMEVVERLKPDWREYFSIYGDGLTDLNYAPKEVIMAVCDVPESSADSLIRARDGADSLPGTEDDVTLTIEAAKSLLGLDAQKYATLQSRINVDHLTRRVESTGYVGDSRFKVVVIARRQDDGSLNYMARLEE